MMNKQKNPEAAVSAESVTGRKNSLFSSSPPGFL